MAPGLTHAWNHAILAAPIILVSRPGKTTVWKLGSRGLRPRYSRDNPRSRLLQEEVHIVLTDLRTEAGGTAESVTADDVTKMFEEIGAKIKTWDDSNPEQASGTPPLPPY